MNVPGPDFDDDSPTEAVWISTRGASPVIGDTTNLGSGTVELTVVPQALELVGTAA